jgi:hypothetical protein
MPPPDLDDERDRIEDRIDRFSIASLGYDRNGDEIRPAVLLAWVRDRKEREAQRALRLGALVTAIITALLGAIAWPAIQALSKYLSH